MTVTETMARAVAAEKNELRLASRFSRRSRQPLVIALLALPILIQVIGNSALAYWLNRRLGEKHAVACPSALIGASNFFELAVAAAISLFCFESGAALATVGFATGTQGGTREQPSTAIAVAANLLRVIYHLAEIWHLLSEHWARLPPPPKPSPRRQQTREPNPSPRRSSRAEKSRMSPLSFRPVEFQAR